jgi:hypothetical protein
MANKQDFKSFMVRNVEFKYPRLAETYRYNTAEKRSEPCPPTASNAAYSIAWEMTQDDARKFYADLKAHYDATFKKAPFSTVFGMRKLDNGNVEFKAKRNGTNASGQVNPKPTVIDGMKNSLADLNIWSGSKGNIRVSAFGALNPDSLGGVSLLIDVVQITHAVYGGSSSLDDFDEVPTTSSGGGQDASLDDFSFGASAPAANAFDSIPTGAADLDDSIPF